MVERFGAGKVWCWKSVRYLVLERFGAGKVFGAIPAVHGFGGNPRIERFGAGKVFGAWDSFGDIFTFGGICLSAGMGCHSWGFWLLSGLRWDCDGLGLWDFWC